MNETATGIGISRLGQIAIHAPDTGRATGFYRDVLGLPLLFMPNHDLWMTFFHDTEGNLLALMSEVPK